MDTKISDVEKLIGNPVPFQRSDEDASPVYFQLAKAIEKQIEKKVLKAGSLLPSERVVASLNKISISTVRRAFEELIGRQYIYRIQGKGTYVSESEDRRKKVRFYPLAKGFHDTNESTSIKFSELTTSSGIAGINDQLNISKNEDLFILKRFILKEDKPTVYCISYLPQKMFKNLEKCSPEEIESYALYILLEQKFEVSTINHIELFSAINADEVIAAQLKIEQGHPLLRIEKLIFTHKAKPYEFRLSYCITGNSKIRRVL